MPCSNPKRVPVWNLHHQLLTLIAGIDGIDSRHSRLRLFNCVKIFATEAHELLVLKERHIKKVEYDPDSKICLEP